MVLLFLTRVFRTLMMLDFRRRDVTLCPTVPTFPGRVIVPEVLDCLLDLSAQVGAMEARLVNRLPTVLAVPPQLIQASLRPILLYHDAHRVREPHGVMRYIRRQEEHAALVDGDVPFLAVVNDLEEHRAFVLVEPFRRLVDVVVGACIGAADDHDGDAILAVGTKVVDGRLELVGVLSDPAQSWS